MSAIGSSGLCCLSAIGSGLCCLSAIGSGLCCLSAIVWRGVPCSPRPHCLKAGGITTQSWYASLYWIVMSLVCLTLLDCYVIGMSHFIGLLCHWYASLYWIVMSLSLFISLLNCPWSPGCYVSLYMTNVSPCLCVSYVCVVLCCAVLCCVLLCCVLLCCVVLFVIPGCHVPLYVMCHHSVVHTFIGYINVASVLCATQSKCYVSVCFVSLFRTGMCCRICNPSLCLLCVNLTEVWRYVCCVLHYLTVIILCVVCQSDYSVTLCVLCVALSDCNNDVFPHPLLCRFIYYYVSLFLSYCYALMRAACCFIRL